MSMRHVFALVTCLTFTACPGDKGDESSTDTIGTTDAGQTEPTTGGDADPACACIDPEQSGAASYVCPEPTCGVVSLKCDVEEGMDPLCDGTVVSFDEAALNCALDQLINRTPGRVEYHTLSDGNGSSSYSGAFISVSDGLTRSYGGYDANSNESAAGFVKLKDPAYFQGCKAEADLAARFSCFTAWSDDEPTAQCDAAEELSEQF